MAKTKSKNKTVAKANADTSSSVPVDATDAIDEMTGGEKLLIATKPYWAHILLGVLSLILGWVLIDYYRSASTESASEQWRSLSNAMTQAQLSGDVASLKTMGEEFEEERAGNWALQMAGNFEINRGIDMLARDRVGGFKMIKQGMTSIEKVVEASPNSKTPMLQRRSLFMLAYAKEALGEFAEAKKIYEQLVEAAPDSEYTDVATRGIERCSNPDYAVIYEKFKSWEEAAETAPGPLVPEKPSLNFDDIELPKDEPAIIDETNFQNPDEMKKEDGAADSETEEATEDTKPETKQAESEAEKVEKAGDSETTKEDSTKEDSKSEAVESESTEGEATETETESKK
jgi:tetratricopeptide (TPR) repeat protein